MVMTRPPLPRRRDRADGFSVWARPCTSPAPSSTPGPPRSCIAYLKRRARRDRGTEPLVAAAAYTAPLRPRQQSSATSPPACVPCWHCARSSPDTSDRTLHAPTP
jgi:hypothetical protein